MRMVAGSNASRGGGNHTARNRRRAKERAMATAGYATKGSTTTKAKVAWIRVVEKWSYKIIHLTKYQKKTNHVFRHAGMRPRVADAH